MIVYCGAKTRSGTECRRPAGWGTEHVGEGRCKLHGGNAGRPIIHGRYSKHLPAQIRAKVETDTSDPLDLLPELQVQRALFSEYLNRWQDPVNPPETAIYAMVKWADDIGKMVERIVRMRNESALTKAEVAFIVARIPDVVMRYVDEPVKQQQFIDELFGITGHSPASLPAIAGSAE